MKEDVFSKYHPIVNLFFFIAVIVWGALIQHPVYLLIGVISSGCYYLILNGSKGWRMIIGMLPLFLFLVFINPLFNIGGETVLFYVFRRPYTLEALYYGVVIGFVFIEMFLWFGCYGKVLTSDKFIGLFANYIPSLSLILMMVFRMIPNLLIKARQIMGVRKSIG